MGNITNYSLLSIDKAAFHKLVRLLFNLDDQVNPN